MSNWQGCLPLILATCLYLWQAGNYFAKGNGPQALVFLSYSMGNVGFIWGWMRA